MWLVAVLRAVLNWTSVNHKWAEPYHDRYITSTSAELFCSMRLFYPLNLKSWSFLFSFCCVVVLCTSLDGFRRTSPTPPPLLSPWLSTVTMHMSKESHVRSLSSITTAGGCTVTEAMKTWQACHYLSRPKLLSLLTFKILCLQIYSRFWVQLLSVPSKSNNIINSSSKWNLYSDFYIQLKAVLKIGNVRLCP